MSKLFAVLTLFSLSLAVLADDEQSVGLFRFHAELAKEGNPDSMYMLGNLYERGAGVKQDYDKALRWYRLASENGNRSANRKIKRLLKKIAKMKQVEAATKAAHGNPVTHPTKKKADIASDRVAKPPVAKMPVTKPSRTQVSLPAPKSSSPAAPKTTSNTTATTKTDTATDLSTNTSTRIKTTAPPVAASVVARPPAPQKPLPKPAPSVASPAAENPLRSLSPAKNVVVSPMSVPSPSGRPLVPSTTVNTSSQTNAIQTPSTAVLPSSSTPPSATRVLDKDMLRAVDINSARHATSSNAETSKKTVDLPESPSAVAAPKQADANDASAPAEFNTNPCNGPSARFMSTCR